MMKKKPKIKLRSIPLVLSLAILGLAILFVLNLKSQENKLDLKDDVGNKEVILEGLGGLPSDFPIYKDSELVTFARSEDGSGMSYIWETDDEANFVYEYLKSELRIAGWSLSSDASFGSSSSVSFEKGNMEGFLGVFIGSGGKTVISVSIRMP